VEGQRSGGINNRSNQPHYSSLPSAKIVRVGLNPALGDEDISYCPFISSCARIGARTHYPKDGRTSLLNWSVDVVTTNILNSNLPKNLIIKINKIFLIVVPSWKYSHLLHSKLNFNTTQSDNLTHQTSSTFLQKHQY
jgi:hypothetical protein